MGQFNIGKHVTMVSHYCNSSIAAHEPSDANVDNIDINKKLKRYKPKKTKNGVCFYTGFDQYMATHFYVTNKGKVSKIFIDLVMDFRAAFDSCGSMELLYNDQFIKKISIKQKNVLKQNKTSVNYRKLIGEIKINSGFLRIGSSPEHLVKEKLKLPKKNKKTTSIQTENYVLDSFLLPVKNKNYPIYINSYLAPDNVKDDKIDLSNISEKKLIVIENIEGCYVSRLTKNSIGLQRYSVK